MFVASIIAAFYAVESYKLQKVAVDRDNPAVKIYPGYWHHTNLAPGGEAWGVSADVTNSGRQLLMVSEIVVRFQDTQGYSEKIEMRAKDVDLGESFNLAPGERKSLNSDKLTQSQFQSVEQSGEIVVTDIAGGVMTTKYSPVPVLHP